MLILNKKCWIEISLSDFTPREVNFALIWKEVKAYQVQYDCLFGLSGFNELAGDLNKFSWFLTA